MSPAENFLEIAEEWLCDEYALSINYFAQQSGTKVELISAAITAAPLKPALIESFHIHTSTLIAGQEIVYPAKKDEVLLALRRAVCGEISTKAVQLQLDSGSATSLYSDNQNRDDWYTNLHLNIAGSQVTPISAGQVTLENHELRCNTIPFDGTTDLCGWLGLPDERTTGRAATITLRVLPPVDMILQDSSIVSDQLIIRLHAHPNLDTTKIKLAIKAYPGNGLKSRFRVENEIKWTGHENGILKGLLNIRLRDSESALGMLILGNQTIRRQWYIDPSRSKNVRYATVQFFDQEIRQTRQAAIESNDSRKLEPAIATLLYLLGFSVTTLIEKDAPDIIAITPSGSILILECTTKIADFSSKLGKLVDRRSGLSKSLHSSSHHSQVHAALVCNLPRDQIAVKEDELLQHGIHLARREDIAHAFDLTQIPKNPDDLLNKAAQEMINRKGARKLQG